MSRDRRRSPRARAAVVALPARRRAQLGLRRLAPSPGSLVAGAAIAACALLLYVGARETSAFALREVEVRGAQPWLAREVRRTLAGERGASLLALDGATLEHRVARLPAVRHASVDRAFPHTLAVTVVPEVPLAVVRNGPESWLVSVRGRIVARLSRGDRPRLPRVWAPMRVDRPGGFVSGRASEILSALRPLAQAKRPRLAVRSAEATAAGIVFRLASGLELRVGSARDAGLKLAIAGEIVPMLEHPSLGGPRYLDVSVPSRPVAGTTLNPNVEVEGSKCLDGEISC